MTVQQIKDLAAKHGWKLRHRSGHLHRLIFGKENNKAKIIVRHRVKCVETELYQEKTGKHTTLERPNYTKKLLEEVFINPRVHTGQGRYIISNDITKKLTIKKFPEPHGQHHCVNCGKPLTA